MPNVTRLRPRAGTYAEALGLWESGQISLCAQMLDGTQGMNSTLLLGRCHLRLGESHAAIAVLTPMLAEDLTPDHAAQARVTLSFAMRTAHQIEDADALEQEAIVAARALGSHALLLELKFSRAVAALRARDYDLVAGLAGDVLSPEAMAVSDDVALQNYPFSLNYMRARFAEMSAFVHQHYGRYEAQLGAFEQALAIFDASDVVDDHFQSALLANYAECGVGLGIHGIADSAAARVVRFTPSDDLYGNLFRTYSAIAEAASHDGDLVGALRTLRQGSEMVAPGRLRLRAMVEKARILRDCGETNASLEEIEAAVRYCRAVDWAVADHGEDCRQLLSLAALVAPVDVEQAEEILERHGVVARARAVPQLRVEDTRLRAEEAYARAAIARAKNELAQALEFLSHAKALFDAVSYHAKAAQVAFEILELSGDELCADVVQQWVDRHPSSPLAGKLAAYNVTVLSYREACNEFDANRNEQCVNLLDIRSDSASVLLRVRALLRLHRFDEALHGIDGVSSHGRAAESLESDILRLSVGLKGDVAPAIVERLATLSTQCRESGFPNLFAEARFLASSAALILGDLETARREAHHVLALDASLTLKPSSYRYDLRFWQARCLENLARCAVQEEQFDDAERFYREALDHLGRSRVVAHRLTAQILSGYAAVLATIGLRNDAVPLLDAQLQSVLWGKALWTLEATVYASLAEASSVSGSYLAMLRYLRRYRELVKDSNGRVRTAIGRVRALRELGKQPEAIAELTRAVEALESSTLSEHSGAALDVAEQALGLHVLEPVEGLLAEAQLRLRDDLSPAARARITFRLEAAAGILAAARGDVANARSVLKEAIVEAQQSRVNHGVYLIDAALALAHVSGDDECLHVARASSEVNPLCSSARALSRFGLSEDAVPSTDLRAFWEGLRTELAATV